MVLSDVMGDRFCLSLYRRTFYLALAKGWTVKESFEMGRQAVAVSPAVSNPEEEVKKFVLLPQKGDHDRVIFNANRVPTWPRNCANDIVPLSSRPNGNFLPSLPYNFLGREVDMYYIIRSIFSQRFTSLVGSSGIGKSSLASAVCEWVMMRQKTVNCIKQIFYVHTKQVHGATRSRSGSFLHMLHKQLVDTGLLAASVEKEVSPPIEEFIDTIVDALRNSETLLVLDGVCRNSNPTDVAVHFLPYFLNSLFRAATGSRVLLLRDKIDANGLLPPGSLSGLDEHIIDVGPLSYENTVKLFVHLVPHAHTGDERRRLIEGLRCLDGDESTNKSEIFSLLGEGVPSKIIDSAYGMDGDTYERIRGIGVGQRYM